MTIRFLVRSACIAALYALLTICFAPFSWDLVQCRVSEALCVLPVLTGAAVPGLFVGCVLANMLLGLPFYDVLFGSLATLISALCTYLLRRHVTKFLSPLPSVVFNALIVGALLILVYHLQISYWLCVAYVAIGQALACFGLGIPLLLALERLPKLWQ